ncbi:MAG: hypothetical protein GY842_27240, partial [bacterium]|nr:hypothetical protein [bacterium]
MKQDHRTRLRMRSAPWVWLCAPLLLASYSAVTGAPPREVFPIPVHTFDLQSPAVTSGLAHADEVLRAVSDESLTTVFPSDGLGLG